MPTLPADLAGAKPRYCYGDKTFLLTFRDHATMALYILAQPTPSKRDADYLAFAKSTFPGMKEESLRELGRAIKAKIKELARVSEPGTLRI